MVSERKMPDIIIMIILMTALMNLRGMIDVYSALSTPDDCVKI